MMPVFDISHCFVLSPLSSYQTTFHRSHLIDVPSKIWRPKRANKYVPLDSYSNNFDDDLLIFTQYGKSVCRIPTAFMSTCTNVHFWDCSRDTPEFKKHLCIGASVDLATRGESVMMVEKYWDVFNEAGGSKTVLGFEFAIDAAAPNPSAAASPVTGPMNPKSSWTNKRCLPMAESASATDPRDPSLSWCPNQEDVADIDNFILFGVCVLPFGN
jgi:hypothetical protein